MSQNDEWENIKTQYLTSPISDTQQTKTKTVFTHLDSFFKANNQTFKDLLQPHNRESFREYLKGKVPNYNSRKTYWSHFLQFLNWLETYLKIEPVSTQTSPEPPAIKGDDSEFERILRTQLCDQIDDSKFELILRAELGSERASRLIAFLTEKRRPDETLQDTHRAFITDRMIREGVFQPTKEEFKEKIREDRFHPPDLESFDCQKLCKKFPQCTSPAMNYLGEINANNCFLTRFPTKCPYQQWLGNEANDPHNPYPKCIAKQNLIPIGLPKDRIIKDPQTCWTCVTQRKKLREQKQRESEYRGQPRVNWGDDIPSSAWSGDW